MELCITFATPTGGTKEAVVQIKNAADYIVRQQAFGYRLIEISVAQKINLNIS